MTFRLNAIVALAFVLLPLVAVTAFPDVKHLKNLKIEENREYLPPLNEAPSNTIESSTGYDYPRPAIPFPNDIESSRPQKTQEKPQPYPPKYTGSPTNIIPQTVSTTRKPPTQEYLPPLKITQRPPPIVSTGAETRIYSSTVKPLEKDYLPPYNDGAATNINVNVIPSPQPELPTNEYLPPVVISSTSTTTTTTTRRPTTTRRTTRRTTTTTTEPPPPPSSYAPAANTPIPSIVKPVGPYYTKFDEENGYDYSKPSVGFDLPNNRIPTLNSADEDEDEENNFASASAPTNNVPVYKPATSTTTTEEAPEAPAPEIIYTPSHTLDDDGYRYKVPNKPFNF